MVHVRSPQDFGSAAMFLLIGCGGLYLAISYDIGTVANMGPGFFPMLLSLALIAIGLLVGRRALVIDGPRIQRPDYRALIGVLAAIILFGLLIEPLGLGPTTFISTLIACHVGIRFPIWQRFALSAGLAVFAVLLFVYGLGQPIHAFGWN